MKTYAAFLAAGALGLVVATPASAQQTRVPAENILQQQRRIDDQLADARRQAAPLDSLLDWQWGGWVEHYSFYFDDGVQKRWFHRPAVALWTRVALDEGAHEFFFRGKLTYEHFPEGHEYDRQKDWVGPRLERGWYQIDVGKAFRWTQPGDPLQMRVKVGRQEVRFGTGYALDMPLDAVTFVADLAELRLRGLYGKTTPSTPNIDRSEAVDSHSARRMYGFELSYQGFDRWVPFAYAFWNDDFTDERPQDPFQNYAYDTSYYAIGSRGAIGRQWRYWNEAVLELGRSYGDRRVFEQDAVLAWALDLGLEYRFDVATQPRISFEYMFASGDGDRLGSPTSGKGGNRDGIDTSFVGFGYRDTGISASPLPSNLHIWRLGGSLTPFEQIDLLKEMELGTNWFYFYKNQRTGAISDPTATRTNYHVGWEMDYFVNWRLMSDLSWTARWGVFFPGQAYEDRSVRHFVFTGMTWSF